LPLLLGSGKSDIEANAEVADRLVRFSEIRVFL